jgi:biotin carboxyl carrier protein
MTEPNRGFSDLATGEVFELVRLFVGNSLLELEFERGDLRVSMRRHESALRSFGGGEVEPSDAVTVLSEKADGPGSIFEIVKSTLVGRSRSPEQNPLASEGQEVGTGQAIGLIEAMKIMNDVAAENPGMLLEFLVKDAQPVEYGQPLAVVQRA